MLVLYIPQRHGYLVIGLGLVSVHLTMVNSRGDLDDVQMMIMMVMMMMMMMMIMMIMMMMMIIPIVVTLVGMVTDVSDEQYWKAYSP